MLSYSVANDIKL